MPYSREHDLLTQTIAREQFPADPATAHAFYRLIAQESAFDLDVISGRRDSPAGARGIAQLLPRFHPDVDPLDPPAALRYAAGYLRWLLTLLGDLRSAVAAYNWGPATVQAALKTYGSGWEAALPEETRRYLRAVFTVEGAPPAVAETAPDISPLFRDAATGWLLPAAGFISQGFGPTDEPLDGPATYQGVSYPHFNRGIDIGCPVGTPVYATTAGRVVWAGWRNARGEAVDDGTGWGLTVWVEGADGATHNYGHLSALAVGAGESVTAGALLGQSGNSGASTGPHLSYDVFRLTSAGLEPLDPTPYLTGSATGEPETMPDVVATVTAEDGLRLRAGPDGEAAILNVWPFETTVRLRRADWYPVRDGERAGWMWGGYLALVADMAALPVPGCVPSVAALVVTDALNLRERPSDQRRVLATLPQGARLSLRQDDWYPVLVGGASGWMHGRYLAFTLQSDRRSRAVAAV